MPLVRSRSESSDPNSDKRAPKRDVTSLTKVLLHWPTFTGAGAACDGKVPIPMLSATRVQRAVLRMLVMKSSKASLTLPSPGRREGAIFEPSIGDGAGEWQC